MRLIISAVCASIVLLPTRPAHAVGEAATVFQIFVPPNAEYEWRASTLVVTAFSDGTVVDIEDTDEDGDNDDSVSAVILNRGQSYVLLIRNGAVNDDAGSTAKWDGDHFIITSSQPVTVQMATQSSWQHDWAPADIHGSRGERFILYSVQASSDNDINVFSYEANTVVEIYDITTTPTVQGGATQVDPNNGTLLLRQTLAEGEDLNVIHGLGYDLLDAGHTYVVLATKPVTVAYGALGAEDGNTQARDGGGFVPASNGSAAGDLFYFTIPHDRGRMSEKELRIVAYDNTTVTLEGWSLSKDRWEEIYHGNLTALDHLDFTGYDNKDFRKAELYRLTATADTRVTLFEANWLETGAAGTSDFASFVSSAAGTGAGYEFLSYIGPPGRQTRVPGIGDYFSHLYLHSFATTGATVLITDVATGGTIVNESIYIPPENYTDLRISRTQYDAMNDPHHHRRPYLHLVSDQIFSVMSTNWNDNWMTYASSALLPEPTVTLTSGSAGSCNQALTVQAGIHNAGWTAGLQDVSLEIELPAGIAYQSSIGDLPPPIVTGPDPNTGITILTFDGLDLPSSGHLTQALNLTVTCVHPQTGQMPTGTLVALVARAEGSFGGQTYQNQASKTISLDNPLGTNIDSLSATVSSHLVTLAWTTAPEVGNRGFRVTRADTGDGPQTVLTTSLVPSKGSSETGFSYTFEDPTVDNCTPYFYRIVAVDGGGNATQTAGPVRASTCPSIGGLAQTGRVDEDFLGMGETFPDPGGSGPGGDVPTGAGLEPSGSDFVSLRLYYDERLDILYVGAETYGIAGDADGDQDPDGTSAALAAAGGTDHPQFESDESFLFVLDIDSDSTPDYIAGTPMGGGLSSFRIATYKPGMPLSLAMFAFDEPVESSAAVLSRVPDANGPHLEFTITNFSRLLGSTFGTEAIRFWAYLGSLSDGPVGEDTLPDNGLSEPTTLADISERLNPWMGPFTSHGEFAAFGNLFSGSPEFDFIPLGFQKDGVVVREAPFSPGQPAFTSPIYFGDGQPVELSAFPHATEFPCEQTGGWLPSDTSSAGCSMILSSEMRHDNGLTSIVEKLQWSLPEEDDEGVLLDNVAMQTFRVIEASCTSQVTAKQRYPLGDVSGIRSIGTSMGVEDYTAQDAPVVVARLDFSRFDPECGELVPVYSYRPEHYLDGWSTPAPGYLDEGFFTYSTLSSTEYLNDLSDPDDFEVTLIPTTLELPRGTWVVNVYYWSWANWASTEIQIDLAPGSDCTP